jgi:hypothetical protein
VQGRGESGLAAGVGSLADTRAAPFVGRGAELAILQRLGREASTAGVRRAVFVVGEAGIGKTRVAAEAATRLHAAGADRAELAHLRRP